MSTTVEVTEQPTPEVIQAPASPAMAPEVSATDLQQAERIARMEERLQQLSETVERLQSQSESTERQAEFAADLAMEAQNQLAEEERSESEELAEVPEVVIVEAEAPAASERQERRPSRWL